MEKRFVIAVVLCVAVLAVWPKLFPTHAPPPSQQTAPVAQTPPAAPTAPSPAAPGAAAPAAPPTPSRPESEVELATGQVRFVFSSLGGTLRRAQLLEPQF